MMKKTIRLLLSVKMVIILLSATSACGAEKMTVLLDWFVNPDHAPLFVALEQGYFEKRGWRSRSSSRPTRTTRPSSLPPVRPISPYRISISTRSRWTRDFRW